MVVAVFEDVVAEGVHAFVDALVLAPHLGDPVSIMVVESVDAAVGRLEHYSVARLRAVDRLQRHDFRP